MDIDGYTYSDPNSFHGRWWSIEDKNWISDKVVLLIIDFQIALTDLHVSLSETISELKDKIHSTYEKYEKPQEEVWIVTFRVNRMT